MIQEFAPLTPVSNIRAEVPPRRWPKRLFRLAVLSLLGVAAIVWFAPTIIAKTGLKNQLAAQALVDFQGKAIANDASLSWFGPLEFRGITIHDAAGRPALTAAKLTTSKTLYQLLTDSSDLGRVTLHEPRLELVIENGNTNIETAIAKYLEPDDTPAKPQRLGLEVEVKNGTIVLLCPERQMEQMLQEVQILFVMPRPRTEPLRFEVSAVSSQQHQRGTLDAKCELLNGGQLELESQQFSLDALAPIMNRYLAKSDLAGRFNSKISTRWADSGSWQMSGRIQAEELLAAGPWLGEDRIQLQQLTMPCDFNYQNGLWDIETLEVQCDFGQGKFHGQVSDALDWQQMVQQSGLNLDATVDLAKLAQLVPGLLHLKKGTELNSGQIMLQLASKTGEFGPTWTGSISTTALRGQNEGRPLIWESPLLANFAGRLREDHLPSFDKLEVQSDFMALAARGEPEAFEMVVNVHLDKLATRLQDFVDLGKLQMAGMAEVRLSSQPGQNQAYAIRGSAGCTNLIIQDGDSVSVFEPILNATFGVEAKFPEGGAIDVESGEVTVSAGPDALSVLLLSPLRDVTQVSRGRAIVKVVGDLQRWQKRAKPFLALPPEWVIGGQGTIQTTLDISPTSYKADSTNIELANARFQGGGINLNEPKLNLKTDAEYQLDSREVLLQTVELTSNTLGARSDRIELKPAPNGEYGAKGKIAMQTYLERLQSTLGLQTDPSQADAIRGLAKGIIELDGLTPDQWGFVADLTIEQFALGSRAEPTWTEPWVKLKADGRYDLQKAFLEFSSATMARDGFAIEAKGSVQDISRLMQIDLDGQLTYDLAKIEPHLKEYLGKSSEISGKDSRPFRLSGNLSDGGKNLALNVGNPERPSHRLSSLAGSAAVAWDTLKAYGFDVGNAELAAKIHNGVVQLSPIRATFGGGQVRIEPSIELKSGAYDLRFAPGKVIDQARLTPAVCADAIGYALPVIANAAQADGLISLDIQDNRIPLLDPTKSTLKGNLTIHEADVSAGPIITEVMQILGVKQTKLKLTRNEVVPIWLDQGRVHHSNFSITIDGVTVRTSGSVGIDGSLEMIVEIPITEKMAGVVLANNPRLREMLAKQTVRIPISGTLTKPKLDGNGIRGVVAKLVQDSIRGMARDQGGELLKEGLGKLFPGLPVPKKK